MTNLNYDFNNIIPNLDTNLYNDFFSTNLPNYNNFNQELTNTSFINHNNHVPFVKTYKLFKNNNKINHSLYIEEKFFKKRYNIPSIINLTYLKDVLNEPESNYVKTQMRFSIKGQIVLYFQNAKLCQKFTKDISEIL